MANEELRNAQGLRREIDEGETFDIVMTFRDTKLDTDIVKAQLTGVTLTIIDTATEAIINGRDEQDIFDDNNGEVASDGELTFKSQSADNPNLGTSPLNLEEHKYKFTWTWIDGDGDSRENSAVYLVFIRPFTTP